MKISGFSFVKNAVKLHFPLEESIRSALPICDEFIIAVGKSEDNTREVVEQIGDPKIRIIDTDWDKDDALKQLILSSQTNIALNECSGDWCFYLQADEVVHEDDLQNIKDQCAKFLDNEKVHGLLFDYQHFWGDFDHCHNCHGWYPREIRVVRNHIGIKSVRDAQSFRLENGNKLNVAPAKARMFHYGYVRPPHLMQNKKVSFGSLWVGKKAAEEIFKDEPADFDYGALDMIPVFKKTHPSVMEKRINGMDWKHKLRYDKSSDPGIKRRAHKHEKLKNRLLTIFEQFTGIDLNKKNWNKLIKK